MKKKIILLCYIIFSLCFLSGCGKAQVTSELKFNSDGSGSRSVYATIKQDDVSSIEGGLEEIEVLLKNAAPEGVTVRRSSLENGDAVFQFTFFFDTIDQYNEIIQRITGKEHNATWYTSSSVFLSNIRFTEDDCTTDLITWAIDAIKGKIAGWIPGNFSNYEVTKNEVYYNEELQYSGTGNPQFEINVAPKVTKASIYTTYSFDGTTKKDIKIEFEKGSLDRVNLTDAKAVLASYSESYSFDRANDIISYELTDSQITEFLQEADYSSTGESNQFTIVNNPFQQKFEIQESYNLGPFFSMFDMSDALYIYDYVKLPAVMNDVEASHTDSLGNITVPDGYDYAGAYRYDETYTASYEGSRIIDLNSINVSYQITKELAVKRQIDVIYNKNGCEISQEELSKYYEDYEDTITLSDNGDTLKVTFILNCKRGTNNKEETEGLSSYKSGRGMKYSYYDVTDNLDITRYLPSVEGYKWNSDKISYDYSVSIEKEAGIRGLTIGNLSLDGTADLSTIEQDEAYKISGNAKASQVLSMDIYCKQTHDLFYLVVILLIFLLIVGGLVVILILMKKKKIIDNTNYDDLEQL